MYKTSQSRHNLTTELLVSGLLVVADAVQHAYQVAVLLLGEVLALVGAVLDLELVEWVLIAAGLPK